MDWLTALYGQAEATLGARVFRAVRYLISGSTAAATNLAILFLLVRFAGVHYLSASIAAFVLSIAVSFGMQKFWTFHDWPVHDAHTQFIRYCGVIAANLILNTAIVYVLVERAGTWYLLAQGIGTVAVAITGYFAYRHFVFRARHISGTP